MPLSPIFSLADSYTEESAALDPIVATSRGMAGYDHLITDFSPDGYAERAEHLRRTLSTLGSLPITNDDDRLARDFISERFTVAADSFAAGEWMLPLRVIGSPVGALRAMFDLMPRDRDDSWPNIAARLEGLPDALAGVRQTLEHARAQGQPSPQRQVEAVAKQCSTWAGTRWFHTLAAEAAANSDLSPTMHARLTDSADAATAAFDAFAGYLRNDYMPHAVGADAAGPERYQLNVRAMLGAELDPAEMYEWAWNDFAELRREIKSTCAVISPGASFAEVRELLNTDPARCEHGVDAYQAWLQATTDEALSRSLEYFEIPEVMRRCEALIPPEGSAAAPYYTAPSEDFSRPGRTWYPTLGREQFPRWGDVTTCYHESVPGHHLQLGYARSKAASLSRIQRNSFIPGHGEGWALYAERLCDEFGWFGNPDYRLGFLGAQMLRTVRVIIDIGMHLGFRIPPGTTLNDGAAFHPGEVWSPELAYQFALSESGQSADFLSSEIDRYLGWPAQAISYKIGEREWLAARADAKSRLGTAFDLRAFHTHALSLGPVGLSQLREELRR
jgi:uncharacterized protein (DUF885 family)